MDTSAHNNDQQRAVEPGLRAPKNSKACVPCRARKVKCDAAVAGLPCSSCAVRKCPELCVLSARRRRTKKNDRAFPAAHASIGQGAKALCAPADIGHSESPDPSDVWAVPRRLDILDSSDSPGLRRPPLDLHYLRILDETVREDPELSHNDSTCQTPYSCRPEKSLTPQNRLWNKLPQLDDIDNEYLARKGVFELPPSHHLDTLIKAYFEHSYPFAAIIDRPEFVREFRSGACSLFLLRAVMTLATVYVPEAVISGCGFESRSAAQNSFFFKAKLLHDFGCESKPLSMLQGSIILGLVILDHPTDRDSDYWFHNSMRLAAKLDLRATCIRQHELCASLKLYRRIWWTLYYWDTFRAFVNTGYPRLLGHVPEIKPLTEDDCEEEDIIDAPDWLPKFTARQTASVVVHCELFQICGQCLSVVKDGPKQDPRQLFCPVDEFRKSLTKKMHVDGDLAYDTSIYYLDVLALSYRFDSILCRLLTRCKRWTPLNIDWKEWAKQRLRFTIIELDSIAKRILINGIIQYLPPIFLTTLPALLALHIETALDPTETELSRSMARISINQTMLVLAQGKEVPALKRALPVFEDILSKKNLDLVPQNSADHIPAQPRNYNSANTYEPADTQINTGPFFMGQNDNLSVYEDSLGFGFLDDWQMEQLDFPGRSWH